MLPEIEYKLQELTNFLGEKKLKQLGLLTCETCNYILAHSEDILPDSSPLQKVYLTPDELADINRKIYESTGLKRPIINEELDSNKPPHKKHHQRIKIPLSSWSQQELNAPLSPLSEIQTFPSSDEAYIEEEVSNNEYPSDVQSQESYVEESADHTTLESNNEQELKNNITRVKTSPNAAYSAWDSKVAEQILANIIADINNVHPPSSTPLGMGYLYNNLFQLPPHALACTECGRLYALAHPSLKLMPLPVSLTPTEYEMLKGVYVDILL